MLRSLMVEIKNELTLKNYFLTVYYRVGLSNIIFLILNLFTSSSIIVFLGDKFYVFRFILVFSTACILFVFLITLFSYYRSKKLNIKFILYKLTDEGLVINLQDISESTILFNFIKQVSVGKRVAIIETKSGKQPILLSDQDRENLESFLKTSKWNSLVVYK